MRPASYDFNQKHIDEPIPGDYWEEMLVMYHVVLRALPNGNVIIADRDRTCKEGQRPDLTKAREITKAEHRRIVTYSVDKLGFVANCNTGNPVCVGWVLEWETDYAGQYVALEPQAESA